jgi:hypothetical protein
MNSLNKRGVELTINFIVMLILGLAVLSGSIVLTKNLFSKATEYKAQVDAQTQDEIRRLITSGNQLVVVYPGNKQVARGKFGSFGVGVNNILSTGSDNFEMDIRYSTYVDKDGFEGLADGSSWLVLGSSSITVAKGRVSEFAVGLSVPQDAQDGVYVYDIQIYHDGAPYSTLQKFYLNVG